MALIVKWLVKAIEPGNSNLHAILRYRLQIYQPYPGVRWSNSLEFFSVRMHQSHQGSLRWNRATSAWKKVLRDL
jgi:hypothetical protein